ncbi:MAG: TRAP transporter small permease [Candidatus Methanomethylicaceae archaeon]
MIEFLNSVLRRLEKVALMVSWVGALFVTSLIMLDVSLRFLMNKPLPAAWEMSELVMPYIVFFALAEALSVGAHVQVTLFTSRMKPSSRRLSESFSAIVCAAACFIFAYSSWDRFMVSFAIKEEILAAISLPWWLGKLAMPIGLGLMGLRYLVRSIKPPVFEITKS